MPGPRRRLDGATVQPGTHEERMMSDCPLDPYAHHYIHCLSFGAQPCGATGASSRTHFRVWAPGCMQVQLELDAGDGLAVIPMTSAGPNAKVGS